MHRVRHGFAAMLPLAGLLAMLACGDSTSLPAVATPDDVDFGEVDVGGSAARDVTLTNTSTTPLEVTDVITSGAGVITSGQALPFTLRPGESTRLFVDMAPTTSGDLSGSVSLLSTTTDEPVTLIRVKGKARLAEQIVALPGTIAFNEVTVGTIASQDVTLTNSGTQEVRVTSLSVSAAGVSVTGLPLPATFAPGESAKVTLAFAPTVAGGVAGSVAVKTEWGRPASVVTVSGTGVSPAAPVTLTAAPARVDVRDVTVGSFSTQGVTLTNSSSREVTISELTTTGTGFSASGIAPATVLPPGGSATVSVKFTPTAVGGAAGQVAVRTAGQTEPLAVVDLIGNGVAAASITSVTVRDGTLEATKTVQMQADVVAVGTIDRSVAWSVDPASLGTIDQTTGIYTAPAIPGAYRVWATSKADPSKKGYGTVTVSTPLQVTPPTAPTPVDPTLWTVQQWESLFLPVMEREHTTWFDAYSRSGNSWRYYALGHGIDGLTAMFAATGNTKYLDRALYYVRNMIASAVRSSSLPNSQYKDGYLGWAAWDHDTDPSINGGEYELYEAYSFRYVTKLLRVMRDNPAVYADPTYRRTYDEALAFIKTNIFDKWRSRGTIRVYSGHAHVAAHWALISLELWDMTEDATERAKYRTVVDNINLHMPNFSGSLRGQMRLNGTAYFWHPVWGTYSMPGQDVSHGNSVIAFIVEAHDRGVEWTDADIRAFVQTFGKIWVRTSTGDKYAAYVDGSGTGRGWYDDGFCKLGRYDPVLQKRLESHTFSKTMQFYGNGALNAKTLNGR